MKFLFYFVLFLLLAVNSHSFRGSIPSYKRNFLSKPNAGASSKWRRAYVVERELSGRHILYLLDPLTVETTTSAAANAAASSDIANNILNNGDFAEMFRAMEESFFRTITFRAFGSFIGNFSSNAFKL